MKLKYLWILKKIKLDKIICNNLSLIILKNEFIVFKFSNVNEI